MIHVETFYDEFIWAFKLKIPIKLEIFMIMK